jgi:hypothetical protein
MARRGELPRLVGNRPPFVPRCAWDGKVRWIRKSNNLLEIVEPPNNFSIIHLGNYISNYR